MSPILAALYLLCVIFLPVFGGYVLLQNRHGRTNRLFAWLSLALLGWVGTLFAFSLISAPGPLLLVGRLNFAAMAFVVTLAYLFTREVAGYQPRAAWLLWSETVLVVLLSAMSPWIDRAEAISVSGVHVTTYGTLFPVYVLHILAFAGAALLMAFGPGRRLGHQREIQLRTVGVGILATVAISLVTNLVLPYWFGNFALIHIGTISTIFFLAAVGYAVFAFHLFDIHVIIRATFVYAGLIALALELYSLSLDFLAKLLPLGAPGERETAATAIVVVVNAFTQEPIRKWLGQMVDRSTRNGRKTDSVTRHPNISR
ncbi:MAG TPA: histidine kinase N-terminal 7TM domain-containing protein [Capsulimonadaceae bacterium]|jgi:hypothetical protein